MCSPVMMDVVMDAAVQIPAPPNGRGGASASVAAAAAAAKHGRVKETIAVKSRTSAT